MACGTRDIPRAEAERGAKWILLMGRMMRRYGWALPAHPDPVKVVPRCGN